MDRRITPANGRVAATHLQGQVQADRFVDGTEHRVAMTLADIRREPGGARERQLVFGDRFNVLEDRDGWSFGQSKKDGYVGYVASLQLEEGPAPTHWVMTPASHLYQRDDIKSPDIQRLTFGAQVTVVHEVKKFFQTDSDQFIPKQHLRPVGNTFSDPASVAQLFFGTPYLWGGNSSTGVDCSGLVQAALLACGIPCPGDSDMQKAVLGDELPEGAVLQRGDLLFWRGHVAMMVDSETMIHANGHHMAVAYEPVEKAIRRIDAQGEGPVIARKRL